jgi:DNA-binding CsgD family transcriptional regulator
MNDLTDSKAHADWAVRPFTSPHGAAFHWEATDSVGMHHWRSLRGSWSDGGAVSQRLASALPRPVSSRWWWLESDDALVWMVTLAGSALLAVAFAWRWSRLRRISPSGLPRHLNAVIAALFRTSASGSLTPAAVHAAFVEVQDRLVPKPLELENWPGLDFNPSEIECANLTLDGLNPNEIAERMQCTARHIYNIRSGIRKKLGMPTEENLEATLRLRKGG